MLRRITIGEQSFSTLRQDNLFYIDKTKFIRDWWVGRNRVTLITRPRRFGKTLMLDTVKTFFAPEFAERSDLFEDLEIWEDEQFRKLQGTIPVIFISFANIKESNYENTIESIKQLITRTYRYFKKQLNSATFSDWEMEIFSSVHNEMSDVTAKNSLLNLCECLNYRYNKEPIILLDEYDSPLQDAWLHNFWDELVDFMRGFFNSTFKTNTYLGRGLITGITRVAKESIFSDMNNLEVVGITSKLYSDCFGFTEQEVFAAMDEYGLQEKEKVKQWYDGFVFGSQNAIYNPWSIIKYLNERNFSTYWGNTSSNDLVGDLIANGGVDIKIDTEKLLNNESFITKLDEQIVFPALYTTEGAIWSLLMASGYVKPIAFDSEKDEYELKITNYEAKRIIEKLISVWFSTVRVDKNKFLDALLRNDLENMNIAMNEIAKDVFSYFDTAKSTTKNNEEKKQENFYHAFVLGLIVDLQQYEIRSNAESGYGRCDVMLISKQRANRGIVIEFKTNKRNETNLTHTAYNALKQIYKLDYITNLKKSGVDLENIYVYGFAFDGKNVEILGGAYAEMDWDGILKEE